jgi:redox-sensitive bicupin YhaK (pirin superfamily)
MHPHRGIETVTYMLAGMVEHQDTLGNKGTIGAGDVQWMTSGRGIMHSEMPQQRDGLLAGFQLWVNLPAKLKMSPPRYQEIPSERIPELTDENGAKVRVITGKVGSVVGPVTEIAAQPVYLDVSMPAEGQFAIPVESGSTVFAYVFEGVGEFGITEIGSGTRIAETSLVAFGDGDHVQVRTGEEPVRFLFIAGRPLDEPIARYGPFVMNTREEIQQALNDLREGIFVKDA